MAQAVQFGVDDGEPPATPLVFGVPGVAVGDLIAEPLMGALAGVHFDGGAGDVVAEPGDISERRVLLVAVVAAQQ